MDRLFQVLTGVAESLDVRAAAWLGAWYLCSLVTLFLNKIILSSEGGNQYVLGIVQMVTTATLGAAKVYGPRLFSAVVGARVADTAQDVQHQVVSQRHPTFWRDMLFVGVMRGATVVCGLISLSHVAVSFTETVKSSAPFFTVIFARVILGQLTPTAVMLSLIPVMAGLALCSATELSFDTIGFTAAIANNVIDCVQNVFSKKLLQYLSPVELQFYTSAAAAILQLPILIYTLAPTLSDSSSTMSPNLIWMIAIDAVFYHLQSVTAYFTMQYLTPVSQSVANTLKRAILIFLSILWFGNEITPLSGIGMLTVIAGVFFYNHVRIRTEVEASRLP
eukprot:m.12294 g.12294  ORF g.12294 m.12294 type:complete len:334 (+) comp5817_c0_seq1:221-1222(+)